jgi:SAM-dependent methyltransferase
MTFRPKVNRRGDLFLPESGAADESTLDCWYRNVALELEELRFSSEERDFFREYYAEGGLLRKWRYPFFRHHLIRTFARAADFLLRGKEFPLIVDLGCGTGTQSLFLALQGARVLGVDLDVLSLGIFRKRKAYYEERLGRSLEVEILCADAFQVDYGSYGCIHGVHSLFAFNLMQPSRGLLSRICGHIRPGGRLAVLDGNRSSWLPKIFPGRRRSVLSPEEFEDALRENGFATLHHRGGVTFPPLVWPFFPKGLLERADALLARHWFFPISHQILAEKA